MLRIYLLAIFLLLATGEGPVKNMPALKQIIVIKAKPIITTKIRYAGKKDVLYELFIKFIKAHEGLRLKPYHTGIDTDDMTIGYGHLIKKGEVFTSITAKEADYMVRRDFNKSIEAVKLYSPQLDSNYSKLLSISHFVFAKGIGNYNRSKLKKKVDSAECIKEEITKWCTIKIGGIRKHHKWMYQNRLFEYRIYKGEMPLDSIIHKYEIQTNVRLQ